MAKANNFKDRVAVYNPTYCADQDLGTLVQVFDPTSRTATYRRGEYPTDGAYSRFIWNPALIATPDQSLLIELLGSARSVATANIVTWCLPDSEALTAKDFKDRVMSQLRKKDPVELGIQHHVIRVFDGGEAYDPDYLRSSGARLLEEEGGSHCLVQRYRQDLLDGVSLSGLVDRMKRLLSVG